MASGDRQRTWFPEMVDLLRGEWRSDTSWDEIIALRDRVDDLLQHIRTSRKLEPVVSSKLCSRCGKPLVQGGGKISVRAMILSIKRFEIAPQDEVKLVEACTAPPREPAPSRASWPSPRRRRQPRVRCRRWPPQPTQVVEAFGNQRMGLAEELAGARRSGTSTPAGEARRRLPANSLQVRRSLNRCPRPAAGSRRQTSRGLPRPVCPPASRRR